MHPLLDIRGLHKTFEAGDLAGGRAVYAVRGVDLSVQPAETVGLVGESGCGKSTLARCAVRLSEPSEGSVFYDGEDLGGLSPAALRLRRRQFQMIFQDAAASLNPRMTIAEILVEPFKAHGIGTRRERLSWVSELLEKVSMDPAFIDSLPESLSGGQQQRVAIARSLALKPRMIIADEPVSALDPSVQAQILNLLVDLRKQMGLTLILISHSLAVVHYTCSRVAVMYLGKIVEESPALVFFTQPDHPYSRILLDSMPKGVGVSRKEGSIAEPPSPFNPPSGCAFHPRCPHVMAWCRRESPSLVARGKDHRVACFLYQ